MRSIGFDDYKQKALVNSQLAKAYAELELEYDLIKELVRYRIDHKITQDELANRTGISKSNISRFESGKHSPTLAMIYRIADGLGKQIEFTIKGSQ